MQRHIHLYPIQNMRKQYAKSSWQSSKEARFWQVSHSPSHDLFFLPLSLYPSISPSVIPSSIFRRLSPPIFFRPRHVGSIFFLPKDEDTQHELFPWPCPVWGGMRERFRTAESLHILHLTAGNVSFQLAADGIKKGLNTWCIFSVCMPRRLKDTIVIKVFKLLFEDN